MARVDRNAARAARSEAENEPHELVLGFDASGEEQVFLLRPRLHVETTSLLRQGLGDEMIKLHLVNPADWERIRAAAPDEDDVLAIIQELYAIDVGESPASTRSSQNGGRKSRRTSPGSTQGSQSSRGSAGATKPSASDASTP